MSDSLNFGKILVGVDWEDKGWVSFGQETYNMFNIATKNRFFDTLYGSTCGGDATKKQSVVPKGLYGLENVEISFNEGSGSYTLGVNVMTGVYEFPVDGSHDYAFWYWLASKDSYTNDLTHTLSATVFEYDNTDIEVASHAVTFDLLGTDEVEARYIAFTTDPSTVKITFVLIKTDTDFSSLTLTLHGILMYDYLGIVVPDWGTGESVPGTTIDNNITSYVIQAQGSIGKTNWETILFDEGQLTLTLNNADKRFSPEYIDGDYYTYLRPYRRIWVSVSDEFGIYRLLWSGWTHQYNIKTGIYNDRQATLTARQGKYNIEAQDSDALVSVADTPSSTLVINLFAGGYVVPSQSEDETITRDIIMQHFDDAGVTVPIYGVEFVENQNDKKYLSSLEHVSELNGSYIFLSRQGKIIFKTYESVKATTPEELPYSLTMEMDYTYSPMDLYKQIIVNYTHYVFTSGIEMQGQDVVLTSGSTDFPFSVYPEYNGQPLIGDVVLDVSSFLPTDYNATPTIGTANAAFTPHVEGLYTWYSGLANDTTDLDYRLSLVSRASGDVRYAKDINQQYIVAGIEDIALDTLTYNNPLITTEDMAEDFANMQISRRASVLSWFNSARIINKNAEAINWILAHSLGDVIYSQEEQSGDIPKHLIIIGENFTYTPGYLQMQYTFAPTGAEVDLAAFDFVVNGQAVNFQNRSVVSDTPTWGWEFGDP